MGKSKKNRAASQNQTQHKSQTSAEAFSFGDPIPVLDRRELLDYVECVQMDRWYEPPVSFDGLARTFRAAVHHSSPIAVKCNILTSTYIPHPLLSQQAFSRFVQDYLVFGNAYLEKRTNRFGEVIALEPALAKYTRRGLDLDTYWFVQYGMTTQPYQFTKGSIFHLMEAKQGDYLVGTDENVLVLNRTYANRGNAERAAKMQWERLQRGVASFSLQLAEGRADLYTEMPVKVSGFKQPIDDAEWTITTLTHTVSPDNGFTTSLELEVRIDDFEME